MAQAATAGPSDAPAPPDQAHVSDPRLRRGSWSPRTRKIAAVVAAAVVLAAGWLVVRAALGVPVSLAVDGSPIVNAQQLLDDLTPQLQGIAAQDGAPLPAGSGCWFAPAEKNAQGTASTTDPGPRVACGPVRLGVAGDDQLWLVSTPQYSVSNGEARGQAGDLDEVAALKVRTLNRPDGTRPPSDDPDIGTAGVRSESGRLVTNATAYLQAADAAFAELTTTTRASTADSTRCYLAVTEVNRAGQRIRQSTGSTWCGPVRTQDSAPGASWVSNSLSVSTGTSLVAAEAASPSFTQLGQTVPRPPGQQLWRPDGLQPDLSAEQSLQPPTADPQQPGYAAVVQHLTAPQPATKPTDGRLVTPALSVTLTALSRQHQVGSGKDALVAAAGEQLVVAGYRARAVEGVSKSTTATLVVDGARSPLPAWSNVADGSWLVVSVPTAARDVDLEVLFDGRAQTISLITGRRAPGAPSALYRSRSTVGVGQAADATVALPKGEPASVSLVVVDATVAAWLPERGWAPRGQAFVRVGLDQVDIGRPCCDVGNLAVVAGFALKIAGQPAVAAQKAGTAGLTPDEAVFVVPQDVDQATLTVEARATFEGGSAVGKPAELLLRLPS